MAQTGRNDPCPCGSSKKYKRCCLQKDEAAALAKSDAAREAARARAVLDALDDDDDLDSVSNAAVDLVNNRTKRIFNDRVGLLAARSTAPFLVQRYQRDTGEDLVDLSVPLYVRGKHWGAVRVSYRPADH